MRRARAGIGRVAGVAATLLLAGCAGTGAEPQRDLGFQWEVKRFYVERATERRGSCTAPAIQTITDTRTIEDSDSRVVMEIRYFWRDGPAWRYALPGLPARVSSTCQGFATRQFTFARRDDDSLQVIEMSGETRNVRYNFNRRTGD